MATTKKATDNKATKKVAAPKVTPKTETKAAETKKPAEKKEETAKKPAKKETAKSVKQFNNSEMKNMFVSNGCKALTNAKDTSNVVYNTFGTKSRVLQQGKAYQLLLTNGHKKVKEEVVESDNNDTERFKKFYNSLTKEEKAMVLGFDTIDVSKLAESEMPRERSVKLIDADLLIKFIKFMATFEENALEKEA